MEKKIVEERREAPQSEDEDLDVQVPLSDMWKYMDTDLFSTETEAEIVSFQCDTSFRSQSQTMHIGHHHPSEALAFLELFSVSTEDKCICFSTNSMARTVSSRCDTSFQRLYEFKKPSHSQAYQSVSFSDESCLKGTTESLTDAENPRCCNSNAEYRGPDHLGNFRFLCRTCNRVVVLPQRRNISAYRSMMPSSSNLDVDIEQHEHHWCPQCNSDTKSIGTIKHCRYLCTTCHRVWTLLRPQVNSFNLPLILLNFKVPQSQMHIDISEEIPEQGKKNEGVSDSGGCSSNGGGEGRAKVMQSSLDYRMYIGDPNNSGHIASNGGGECRAKVIRSSLDHRIDIEDLDNSSHTTSTSLVSNRGALKQAKGVKISRHKKDKKKVRILGDRNEASSTTKLTEIILGITGQAAVNIIGRALNGTSPNSPAFFVVVASTAIGFIFTLIVGMISNKQQHRVTTSILRKIGITAVVCGTIVAMGMSLPGYWIWISAVACLITALAVAFSEGPW